MPPAPIDQLSCCTHCRLVQPQAPTCRACTAPALVSLDRHTLTMLLAAGPPGPRLHFEVLTLLLPAILGIIYTVGVLSYLLLTNAISQLPWGDFSQSFFIVGVPAMFCLVAFYLFSRRRAAVVHADLHGTALQKEQAYSGVTARLEGTVQRFISDAACLASCTTIRSAGGATLLRLQRASTFLLTRADGSTRLVEGELWCDLSGQTSTHALDQVPQVLECLGLTSLPSELPRGAQVQEHYILDGDAVTIHAERELSAEGHPATAQLYREGGQTAVLRGEPGRPLWIER